MKIRNKNTGETGYLLLINWYEPELIVMDEDGVQLGKYSSLAEFNKEWEDYEEPKEFYVVDLDGEILPSDFEDKTTKKSKELGNYFETKEEAEKAVEKLKAWKRLKDKGFRFTNWKCSGKIEFTFDNYIDKSIRTESAVDDLDLLFGGK